MFAAPTRAHARAARRPSADGQWIGLVLHYSGGNNGIDKVMGFSVGTGGGAPMTFFLGTISYKDAFGWTGDMEF